MQVALHADTLTPKHPQTLLPGHLLILALYMVLIVVNALLYIQACQATQCRIVEEHSLLIAKCD